MPFNGLPTLPTLGQGFAPATNPIAFQQQQMAQSASGGAAATAALPDMSMLSATDALRSAMSPFSEANPDVYMGTPPGAARPAAAPATRFSDLVGHFLGILQQQHFSGQPPGAPSPAASPAPTQGVLPLPAAPRGVLG